MLSLSMEGVASLVPLALPLQGCDCQCSAGVKPLEVSDTNAYSFEAADTKHGEGRGPVHHTHTHAPIEQKSGPTAGINTDTHMQAHAQYTYTYTYI